MNQAVTSWLQALCTGVCCDGIQALVPQWDVLVMLVVTMWKSE
jgi:hypothetical protein